MRRAIVPLALVLALVTGVVLDATGRAVRAPAVSLDGDPQTAAAAALIRRFYAAVNATLTTGDATPLAGILAADLIDHAPSPGTTAGRAEFVRSLQSLHAITPTLRLTVLDLLAQADRVAAWVRVEGGEDATFLGLPVAPDRLWGAVDLFQVAGGRVVEHWGDPAGRANFTPLLRVATPVEQPTRKAVTLERWTYAPNAGETVVTDLGFLVVLVDVGTLTVAFAPSSLGTARRVPRGRAGEEDADQIVGPGDSATLEAGDALVISQLDRFDLRNDGRVPAVALVVGAMTQPPYPGGVRSDQVGVGAAATGVDHALLAGALTADLPSGRALLAGGLTANLPAGAAAIAIGRAALSPGAVLPPHRVGVAELVAVEAGALAVTADDNSAWVMSSPPGGTHRAGAGTVPAGGGVFVEAESVASYRAAGNAPLEFILVTFGVAADDGGTPVPFPAMDDKATRHKGV